jgi:hypothetical protein
VGAGLVRVARAGDVLSVRLAWRATDRPAADYTVFLHLAAADERILAQHDAQPLGGTYPTSIWEAGEVVVETVSLSIPADAAPGAYALWMGMYDARDNRRLSVTRTGRRLPEDRVPLGQVRVSGAGP